MQRALALFLLIATFAGLFGVAGVFLLFGLGWALIAVALALGAVAEALRRGMSANV